MLIDQITPFIDSFIDVACLITAVVILETISVCCEMSPWQTFCHIYKHVGKTPHLGSSTCLVFFWSADPFRYCSE